MNIYDDANNFARALKNCPEVVQLREASKKIEGNSSNKKMLEDFRKIQLEAYTENVQKGEISKETKEKFEKLGSILSMNPEISNYLMAEQKFGMLWEDIMKLLNQAIGVDLGFQENK